MNDRGNALAPCGLDVAGDRHEPRRMSVAGVDVEYVGGMLIEHHGRKRHEFGALQPLVDRIVDLVRGRGGEDRASAERAWAEFHAIRIDRDDAARDQRVDRLLDGPLGGACDLRQPRGGGVEPPIMVAAEIEAVEAITRALPGGDAVALVEIEEATADWQAIVPHGWKDEDPLGHPVFKKRAVESYIGEHAAAERERTQARARLQRRNRPSDHPLGRILDRGRRVLPRQPPADQASIFPHHIVRRKIRGDLARGADRKMRHNLVGGDRLAVAGEAGELALVPMPHVAERDGEEAVEVADAVDLVGPEQLAVAAGENLDAVRLADAYAVGDVVANPVRRVDERVIEIGKEIGREGMGGMMIVDPQSRLGESIAGAQPLMIENVDRVLRALAPVHVAQQDEPLLAEETVPGLLDPPPPAQLIGLQLEMPPRHADHVDVMPTDAGAGEAFVDRRERPFGVHGDAGVLLACQPLERDGGKEPVVVEQARRGVVLAVMDAEDEHAIRLFGPAGGRNDLAKSTLPGGRIIVCGEHLFSLSPLAIRAFTPVFDGLWKGSG